MVTKAHLVSLAVVLVLASLAAAGARPLESRAAEGDGSSAVGSSPTGKGGGTGAEVEREGEPVVLEPRRSEPSSQASAGDHALRPQPEVPHAGEAGVHPDHAALKRKYTGADVAGLAVALREVDEAYDELRERALAEKRAWGDFILADPDPEGRTVVWNIWLERDRYPDLYALGAERSWLRERLKSLR